MGYLYLFKTCLGIIANANPNDTALNCDRISRTAVVVLGSGQINAGAGGANVWSQGVVAVASRKFVKSSEQRV